MDGSSIIQTGVGKRPNNNIPNIKQWIEPDPMSNTATGVIAIESNTMKRRFLIFKPTKANCSRNAAGIYTTFESENMIPISFLPR
mmetsp:Transcript_22747/g.34465  ORF Transcript_22747/g.34465 Transcript_22747/m.34465 type:complete len:85 (-) Transcript_22747:185-439(-)